MLVGLSIYLLATQNDLTVITGNRIASGAVLILIAGLITSVISFIGVLGAVGMWSVLLIVVSGRGKCVRGVVWGTVVCHACCGEWVWPGEV